MHHWLKGGWTPLYDSSQNRTQEQYMAYSLKYVWGEVAQKSGALDYCAPLSVIGMSLTHSLLCSFGYANTGFVPTASSSYMVNTKFDAKLLSINYLVRATQNFYNARCVCVFLFVFLCSKVTVNMSIKFLLFNIAVRHGRGRFRAQPPLK